MEAQGMEHHNKGEEKTTVRGEKLKADLQARLSRVEGQIRGIRGMIEKDAYCDDVLNQIAAARAALDAAAKLVLENHIRCCFVTKIRNGDEGIVDELLATVNKLL